MINRNVHLFPGTYKWQSKSLCLYLLIFFLFILFIFMLLDTLNAIQLHEPILNMPNGKKNNFNLAWHEVCHHFFHLHIDFYHYWNSTYFVYMLGYFFFFLVFLCCSLSFSFHLNSLYSPCLLFFVLGVYERALVEIHLDEKSEQLLIAFARCVN